MPTRDLKRADDTSVSKTKNVEPVARNTNIHHTSDGIIEQLGHNDQQRGSASNDGNSVTPTPDQKPTPGDTKTGSGKDYYEDHANQVIGHPEGIKPSWEQDAKDLAEKKYQLDKEQTVLDNLHQRQEIEEAGRQGQEMHAMQQYSDKQSAQRAGWTGGYVLDQNRQREYLKASIQANMYGSMELQKLGYESQLAAARLAYDINKEELALERYRMAYEHAIHQAQLTGYWISPEIHDMNQQYLAAEQILAGLDLDDDAVLESSEYQRARNIMNTIENWYAQHGVSPAGVKTLAQREFDFLVDEARIDAALNNLGPGEYAMTNEDGDYLRTPEGRVRSINLYDASDTEIMEFLEEAGNGSTALNKHLETLASNRITELIGANEDATVQEIMDKFDENNPVIPFLTKLGEDVIDYLREDRITTDEDGNRIYTMTHQHGEHTFTIQIGLDGQETSQEQPTVVPRDEPVKSIEDYDTPEEVLSSLLDDEAHPEVAQFIRDIMEIDFENMDQGVWDNWWANSILTQGAVNAFRSRSIAETVEVVSEFLDQFNEIVGEHNLNLMIDKHKEWLDMDQRARNLLDPGDRQAYEDNAKFIENYETMLETLRIASMHDTHILSGGWQYTQDAWARHNERWREASNPLQYLRALGGTGVAINETAIDTVVSIIRGIAWDWWQ